MIAAPGACPSPKHRALVLALLDLGIEIDAESQAAAALIGINQTDLICLNALFRPGAMTAGQLATTIGLTSGATTTAIDRLERAGYVHRQPDPSDRRRVLVEASRQGAHQAFSLFDDLLRAHRPALGQLHRPAAHPPAQAAGPLPHPDRRAHHHPQNPSRQQPANHPRRLSKQPARSLDGTTASGSKFPPPLCRAAFLQVAGGR